MCIYIYIYWTAERTLDQVLLKGAVHTIQLIRLASYTTSGLVTPGVESDITLCPLLISSFLFTSRAVVLPSFGTVCTVLVPHTVSVNNK